MAGDIYMEKNERPKLKLPKSRFEMTFDSITVIVFFLSIVSLVNSWIILPAEVPAHNNIEGEVDRWGSKWEILITPIVAALMWISMTVLEKYPHVYNYLNLRQDNVRVQYMNARLMLNVIKNIMVLFFAYISWNNIQVALKKSESLGGSFAFIFLGALFIPMIFFIIRSLKY